MRLKKLKKSEIETLAKEILSIEEPVVDEDTTEVLENPDVVVEPQPTYERIPTTKEVEKVEAPTRVVINAGNTKANAFVLGRRIEEMYTILGRYFGNKTGDYFLLNENTSTSYVNNQRKRYRCISVEDKFGFIYYIWFDLTAIGPIY